MSSEPENNYLEILKEELLKIPGKVSARMAAESNPDMITAIWKQAVAQAYRKARIRYRRGKRNR
jgi:hypothetical protein